MYKALREGQLLRLYPGKESVVRNLLAYLVKQGRITCEDGLYFIAHAKPDNVDWGLLDAAWVLADFSDQLEYHAVGDYPVKIIFIMGQERKDPPHYIVLVDDVKQIADLDLPHVNGYCTVSPDGTVQYYQKN